MYYLSEFQQKLKSEIRAFTDEEIMPHVSRYDALGTFPYEIVEKIRERRYCGLPFSKELGGEGYGVMEWMIFLEEISRGMPSLGISFCAYMLPCCYPVKHLLSQKQKEEWLIPTIKGEKLLAFALSEEIGGSNAFAIDTIATTCAEGWILNGSKCWISNAGVADGYILAAKTSKNSKTRDVSLFYVDAKNPGVSISVMEDMIGCNNSPTGTVCLKNCVVPKDALIVSNREGYKAIKAALNLGRLSLAAVSVGIAQAAFENAVSFASTRESYEREIFSYQGISFPISDIYTNICLARNMLYHVAAQATDGLPITMETAALKLFATEMCQNACRTAALSMGSSAFRKHSPMEILLRDCQLMTVAEGTSQICKLIISGGITSALPDNLHNLDW